MRIRSAIFGVYVAASALGFCVLMSLVLRDVRRHTMESMRRTLSDVAQMLAAAAESGRENDGDASWVQRVPIAAARRSAGVRVFITDEAGNVLVDSGERDRGRHYTLPPQGSAVGASGESTVENNELRAWAPVRGLGGVHGYVGVTRPLESAVAEIARARWRLVAYGAAVASVMLIAGWWIAQRLTHSLEKLTRYVGSMAEGQRAEPPISRATEVTALTKAFERMRQTLEGKAYVERYTQALAHELKAPLAAIRGAVELLQEELPPEERRRFLRNLDAESERIGTIVERLLELSAVEARHGRIEAAEVELLSIVREVIGSMRISADQRRVRIDVRGEPIVVQGERFLLARAVANLVQNAIDFSPESGCVRVSVSVASTAVDVVVEDEGEGIPDFARERIFERFYSLPRAHSGRKSTGLGLSFVREVAALHGGTITVVNGAASGVRAVLKLPR